jgi:hypothetical protein
LYRENPTPASGSNAGVDRERQLRVPLQHRVTRGHPTIGNQAALRPGAAIGLTTVEGNRHNDPAAIPYPAFSAATSLAHPRILASGPHRPT